MSYNLSSLLQFFNESGWTFAATVDAPHPARRGDVMEAFDLACIVSIQEWAQENVSSFLIQEWERDGFVKTSVEWDWGDSTYQFSVTVKGMEPRDLWWMFGEHVVYKHHCDHALRAGPWDSGNSYQIAEHCLEIGAQVVEAVPVEGGMTIKMVASRFRDPDSGDNWEEKIENGLGDWDYHKHMEKNQ